MPRPKAKKKKDWGTYKELSERLGLTDRTLRNYRKENGFPAKGTVSDIQAWIARREITVGTDKTLQELTPAEIHRRKRLADMIRAEEEARLAKIERMESEKELVKRDIVKQTFSRIAMRIKNRLMNIGAQVRQECAGLLRDPRSSGQIEDSITDKIRDALEKLSAEGSEIE